MPTSLGIKEPPCVVSLITAHQFKVTHATMGGFSDQGLLSHSSTFTKWPVLYLKNKIIIECLLKNIYSVCM